MSPAPHPPPRTASRASDSSTRSGRPGARPTHARDPQHAAGAAANSVMARLRRSTGYGSPRPGTSGAEHDDPPPRSIRQLASRNFTMSPCMMQVPLVADLHNRSRSERSLERSAMSRGQRKKRTTHNGMGRRQWLRPTWVQMQILLPWKSASTVNRGASSVDTMVPPAARAVSIRSWATSGGTRKSICHRWPVSGAAS